MTEEKEDKTYQLASLSADKHIRSGRDGCTGFRAAYDDFMKRLWPLPLNDMNAGHLLMQGFKCRF